MIGKVIKSLLAESTELTKIVPANRIFPYVINENTPLPSIIYTIDSYEPEYDKSGVTIDSCVFSVVSFSDNYSTLQDIALAVRNALELKRGIVEGISFNNIYMGTQTEGYNVNEDVFLNKITFSVERIG